MSRLLFIFLLMTTLLGCSQQDDVLSATQQIETDNTYRTVDEAMKIAQEAGDSDQVDSRSSSVSRKVKSIFVIGADVSRSFSNGPLIYAVDYQDNRGFCLIAAPKVVEPILAVIDNGSFEDPSNLTNDSYQTVLALTADYVAEKQKTMPVPIKPAFTLDTLFFDSKVEPFVKVQWGQAWPENTYSPNKKAGCGPVGISQILSAFSIPVSMKLTFPGAIAESITIDWEKVKKHAHSDENMTNPSEWDILRHKTFCYAPDYAHQTIGLINREIGWQINATYDNPEHTGANRYVAYDYLKKILSTKTCTYGSKTETLFSKLMREGGVAAITGDNNEAAHFWIADGAWEKGMVIYQVIKGEYVDDPDKIVTSIFKDTRSKLIHYNWGWGGNCNGYFLSTVLDPNRGKEYENDDEENSKSWQCTYGFEYYHFK